MSGGGTGAQVPSPAGAQVPSPAAASPTGAGAVLSPAVGRLRLAAWASVLALLVQFLLGMANNLFTSIPHRHPWTDASPIGLLWVHVVVGVALLGNAFMVLNRSRASANARVAGAALAGLVGVVVALGAGVAFVANGQSNGASMAMSVGFALAVAGYGAILWLAPWSAAGGSATGGSGVGSPGPGAEGGSVVG